MTTLMVISLALLCSGVLGGALLSASAMEGKRAVVAWLLWLSVPFVVLAIHLTIDLVFNDHPDWTPKEKNFTFVFLFLAIPSSLPWSIANLFGWFLGTTWRERRAKP